MMELDGSLQILIILYQYQQQLQDKLGDIHKDVLSLNLDDSDELCVLQSRLNKEIFDCSLSIKKLLLPATPPSDTSVRSKA